MIRLGPHQTLEIRASTPEVLVVESTWEPGGGPPLAHFHPAQDERFEVLEGELTVRIDGGERVLAAGEVLEIPAGSVHEMWNAGETTARATWRVTPALRTEEMFRTIAAGGVEDFLERFASEFRLAG